MNRFMTHSLRQRSMLQRHANGFSILEALVTIVVVSAGLLGLAGLQSTLTREADASRQRGEATRLAQERIETIRSFHQIASVGTLSWDSFGWDDLPDNYSDSDTITDGMNTSYEREWDLEGESGDPYRVLRVKVEWVDRANVTQRVELNSIIAKTELAMSGGLGFEPPVSGAGGVKQVKNRNMNIPFPAIKLNDKESAYGIDNEYTIIFNNQLGSVFKECTTSLEAIREAGDSNSCEEINGYVVAGYIALHSAVGTSGWPRASTHTLSINLKEVVGLKPNNPSKTSFCRITEPPTTSNDGVEAIRNYRYYICVLYVPQKGDEWSGPLYFEGIGLAGSNTRICRYEYLSLAVTKNEQNPGKYENVDISLDNQNYMIIPGGTTCSSINILPKQAPLTAITAHLKPHQYCSGTSVEDDLPCSLLDP